MLRYMFSAERWRSTAGRRLKPQTVAASMIHRAVPLGRISIASDPKSAGHCSDVSFEDEGSDAGPYHLSTRENVEMDSEMLGSNTDRGKCWPRSPTPHCGEKIN